MKLKKLFLTVLSIATLILELLPYGAVLYFQNPYEEARRQTYSYFSLLPFGYANVGPLLTALLTCILLILLVAFWVRSNQMLNIAITVVTGIAICTSLLPLLLGVRFFSAIGAIVTLLLALSFGISLIKHPKN